MMGNAFTTFPHRNSPIQEFIIRKFLNLEKNVPVEFIEMSQSSMKRKKKMNLLTKLQSIINIIQAKITTKSAKQMRWKLRKYTNVVMKYNETTIPAVLKRA